MESFSSDRFCPLDGSRRTFYRTTAGLRGGSIHQTFSATADGFQSQFNAILAAYRAGTTLLGTE